MTQALVEALSANPNKWEVLEASLDRVSSGFGGPTDGRARHLGAAAQRTASAAAAATPLGGQKPKAAPPDGYEWGAENHLKPSEI